jgi:hypothetical protein
MGYQKITITVTSAPKNTGYGLYLSISSGRSASFLSDEIGEDIGTFKYDANINTATENLYNAISRDLNSTSVFGPVDIEYNGTDEISIGTLDESITSITASGFGNFAGGLTTSSTTEDASTYFNQGKKINVRSPYMFEVKDENNIGGVIDSARLDIYVYDLSRFSNRPTEPTYRIVSAAPQGDSTSIYFNLSEYAKDFFQKNLIGVSDATNTQYVDVFPTAVIDGVEVANTPEFFIGYYGYGYIEDGVNPQNSKAIMMSNDTIYGYGDTEVAIPLDGNLATNISFLNDEGEEISSEAVNSSNFSTGEIVYKKTGGATINSLQQYWNDQNITNKQYEENPCYLQFFEDYEIQGATKAIVTYNYQDDLGNTLVGTDVVKIKTVEECKYTPVKVKFVNKFGALQNVWFYKNSSISLTTEEKSFRRNNFNYQAVGFESQGTYSQSNHQYKNLFKEGKEKISINSGFYPESHNEVFRQLMLSEDVWIEFEGERHPVNISSSDIKFKTSVNDKLISYSLDLDFAYDKVQNIT